ncbi:hypothetical protein ATDW_01150 [Asticcacaulis sp. DW145]|uniref:hypothetical protein n=1 Tax=Asticcacaulis sp. DW145 TaxID=3095608 RepID=UPI0030895613|nr:hypothetical protein ATDW_01150 [Asticcacaulis sp. DW145]
MHPRDWKKFFDQGYDREIRPVQVPLPIVNYLGASSRNLIVHHSYVFKALNKHDIPFEQFPMIFETVDHGTAIKDKPRHVTFFHFDKTEWNRWFQVTIKVAGENRDLYLCTFYKTKETEVRRRMKNAEIIK